MKKIAVCTTFPYEHFNLCAAEMLASFHKNWPEDIKLYVQIDEIEENKFKELNDACLDITKEGRLFISGLFEDKQKEFIERWKDYKPAGYLYDVVKFSYKVFTAEKCADAIKDDYDYLIWLDADVITKSPVTHEWLEDLLPESDQVLSTLDRVGFYPECGFVAYNLKNGGYEVLKEMLDYYYNDKFKEIQDGWTDCHILREICKDKKIKNLSDHYVVDKTSIEVWPKTKLAEKMVHRKGKRKYIAAQDREMKQIKSQEGAMKVVDVNNMGIKTRNCLDHDKICNNIKANLTQIRHWVTPCRPTDQEIVMCAAGPSLVHHIEEIKKHQKIGNIIVSVKHALDTLRKHKIKPDYCVLLDPRPHVESFVTQPDQDVIYLVSSMCDPSVVETLNKNKCTVIGYHALVNAGELEILQFNDLPIAGGSATSTRAIGIFSDIFGYKDFHLYAYDLCHYQKPDLEKKDEDGKPVYFEVNLGCESWGNKYVTRTFWTEGQFLAQSQELMKLYKERKDITINVYGDGIGGWMFKHYRLLQKYIEDYNHKLELAREGAPTMKEYINACSRGSELSRGN